MNYLYHRVPLNGVIGDRLYPLNTLQEQDYSVYAQAVSKYKGRESIMEQRIPTLDCLWNDVLFMTAVKPEDLRRARESVRLDLRSTRFFRFVAEELDHSLMTVWLAETSSKEEKDFVPFKPEDMPKYSVVPQKTLDYWKRMAEAGKPMLLFPHIPHILYRGSLDVRKAELVSI